LAGLETAKAREAIGDTRSIVSDFIFKATKEWVGQNVPFASGSQHEHRPIAVSFLSGHPIFSARLLGGHISLNDVRTVLLLLVCAEVA
jgi:hypothetical protein